MTVKSCEKLEKSQVALTVEVGAEEFETALEKAYRKMRKNIRVPGFRPGKAPRKIVEGLYGVEVFFEEAMNAAFPDAYEAAMKEQGLRAVGTPSVKLEGEASRQGFTFTATVPVYPDVTLGQYQGLTAPKREAVVTDEDVEERIRDLRERNTRLVSVEREAREGDVVLIDYEGFMDGKAFQGGKDTNYNLELGSHKFIPGFEEQLLGVTAGEERDIHVTFPEEYAADLAGKAADFHVVVHEVKEKDAPEIDDEFAKDVSEFDTLEELRGDLRQELQKQRDAEVQREFEDDLMNQVADGITAEIPDILVENQARQFVDNLRSSMYQQGLTYEQYQQMTGSSTESILESAREPALKQVRMDLAVTAIIEQEKLEATDEDVAKEYEKVAEETGLDLNTVKQYFTEDTIKDRVLTQKAIAVVTDSATASEWKEPEQPESDTAGA